MLVAVAVTWGLYVAHFDPPAGEVHERIVLEETFPTKHACEATLDYMQAHQVFALIAECRVITNK